MNAYVMPFEHLTMRDVETVGGKNASLGEMIGQLASARRACAGRFCHHRAGVTGTSSPRAALPRRISGAAAGPERRRRDASSPPPAPRSERTSWRRPFPAALEAAVRAALAKMSAGKRDRRRGALLGHRRGSARGLLRRTAGDVSQRARRGGGAARDARGVRLAVQRSRDRLSRAPWL